MNLGLALRDQGCCIPFRRVVDLIYDARENRFLIISDRLGLGDRRRCAACEGTAASSPGQRCSGKVFDTLLVTSVIDSQDEVVNHGGDENQEEDDMNGGWPEARVVVTGASPFGNTVLEEELKQMTALVRGKRKRQRKVTAERTSYRVRFVGSLRISVIVPKRANRA